MPIAEGTENVSANMPSDLAQQIGRLAKASGMSRSKYAATVLQEAANQRRVFRVTADVLTYEPPPYRTKTGK